MFPEMENKKITLDDYINNILTESDINETIEVLVKTIQLETRSLLQKKEHVQLYVDCLRYYFGCAVEKCEKDETNLAKLEKDIAFCKNKVEMYEKSLWSVSSGDEDDVSWLKQLEEKNARIDVLKSTLFCHKEMLSIDEVANFYFKFYLVSVTQKVLELEQIVASLRDIEKDMKERAASSSGKVASSKGVEQSAKRHAGDSEVLEDGGDENGEDDEATNKEIHDLEEWYGSLWCFVNNLLHIHVPFEWWNRKFMYEMKKTRLINIEKVFEYMMSTTENNIFINMIKVLVKIVEEFRDDLHIQMFVACYENSFLENQLTTSIVDEQFRILENEIIENFKKHPSPTVLDELNDRVVKLEDQYAKLTEKSGEETARDRLTALSENLIKYKAKTEDVRSECQKLMEKHQNEYDMITADTYTSTLDAENRKCPVEVEEQQSEESSGEQETSVEAEASYSKADQTSEESEKKVKNEKKTIQSAWKTKCRSLELEDEIKRLKLKFDVYKHLLSELMRVEDIDKMIAEHQAKKSTKDPRSISKSDFNKLLFYYNAEQAVFIQTAIRHGNKHCDRLRENKIAKHTCVKSQNNTSRLKCDTCKISDKKLHFATKVICDISYKITNVSAICHMLPFKKFFKTITQYIITKEKAEPKRRKRKKRAKATGRKLETSLAEEQELSHLSGDKDIDSPAADICPTEEDFNVENPVKDITENIESLTILDEEDVGELDEN